MASVLSCHEVLSLSNRSGDSFTFFGLSLFSFRYITEVLSEGI